ncbi:methyltransferase domain-containing protein [Amycolatopsis jiangsuensis]|uniref:Ubiquinone/menaquinone biosynthesis C-methylase UbiE n=1 Tax=Amycolatopsis jiangsuensis TaxID=1181879 RepID=A0A840J6F0_9PSEU|nr:ubiquinone/menaquinone biosynthesis C-methylase UbiE [Amycolatopsis jiangsuensis]
MLDLGCGDGELLAVFADHGAQALAGVDLSAQQLELARHRPSWPPPTRGSRGAAARRIRDRHRENPAADVTVRATVAGMTTPAEVFLRDYHDRKPEAASELAVAGHIVGDDRTVYEVFADHVGVPVRVLDLGCGDGALLAVLAARGARTQAGIDLSPGHIRRALERPALAGADLRAGRAQELPFADGAFDAVVSFMALMLMVDVEKVVAEAARVLAPGGTFALGVGGPGEGALEVFPKIARPLFAVVPEDRRVPTAGDPRTRTRAGLDELLAPAGFEPVAWHEVLIDVSGPPEQVWQTCCETYYQMDSLDETQLTGLRTAFKVATRDQVTAEGRLPAKARVHVAVTRLRS